MYSHKEERLAGSFCDNWALHERQFAAACDDYDVPMGKWGPFLLLFLRTSLYKSLSRPPTGSPMRRQNGTVLSRLFLRDSPPAHDMRTPPRYSIRYDWRNSAPAESKIAWPSLHSSIRLRALLLWPFLPTETVLPSFDL